MTAQFTDAFFYIALLAPNDAFHVRVVTQAERLRGSDFVTTDAVLLEVLAYFAERGPHVRLEAAGFVADLRDDPRVLAVPVTRELFDNGLRLCRARPDKGYSLTDCISMLVCRGMGITQILSDDHHFEQEGFSLLL